MSKFITKRLQNNLHVKYTYYRQQNMHPHECHEHACKDLGLPVDFYIEEFEVVENDDKRALDNGADWVGIKRLARLLDR